jgi:hypothetical protein
MEKSKLILKQGHPGPMFEQDTAPIETKQKKRNPGFSYFIPMKSVLKRRHFRYWGPNGKEITPFKKEKESARE